MSETSPVNRTISLVIGTAAILFTAFILARLWQTVFGWLLFMLLLSVVTSALHNAVRLSAYGSLAGRVIASATASLRDGIACVTLGVAIVVVAQLALWTADRVSPDAVRAAEVWLSSARGAMERFISLRNLLVALAVATVLSLLIPQSWALRRFSRARDIAAAVYLVLLTVTSFTFFSGLGVANGEKSWNAKLRADVSEALAERDRAFVEAAGAAWTEQKLRELTEDERTAIQAFFAPPLDEVRNKLPRVKANLAHAAAGVDRAERPTRPAGTTEQRFHSYSTHGSQASSGYPTMSELAALAQEAKDEAARHRTLREAAATAAAAALSELVPGLDGGVAQELVKSLTEAVGAKIAAAAMPDVATLNQLRDWVRSAIRGHGASSQPAPKPVKAALWTWQRADFELDRGQLSRRVARDLASARDRLVEMRVEAEIELRASDLSGAQYEQRERKIAQDFAELEGMLEKLATDVPGSSAEITRFASTLLTARGGRGWSGGIRPLPRPAIETKPRPPVRAK